MLWRPDRPPVRRNSSRTRSGDTPCGVAFAVCEFFYWDWSFPLPVAVEVVEAVEVEAEVGSSNGDTVYLTFGSASAGPVASWSASTPNSFTVSSANDSASDLGVSSDGTMFAMRANHSTEIRNADLSLSAVPTSAELESVIQRVAVPGITLHPTGALVYEPFLDGPPPSSPPASHRSSRWHRHTRRSQWPLATARVPSRAIRDALH